MKRSIFLILQLLTSVVLSATSVIEQASVTMPYSELYSLLQRVNEVEYTTKNQKPQPPVDILVHSANYVVHADGPETGSISARFEVSNLSEDWQTVPLFEASQAVQSIQPADAKLVEIEGMMHLLLGPLAVDSIQINLIPMEPIDSRGGETIADFIAAPAVSSSLEIENEPAVSTVLVFGSVGSRTESGVYGLPSSGGPVQVKLLEAEQLLPASWNMNATYAITERGGYAVVYANLLLNASDNGDTSQAEILLPVGATISTLSSDGMASRYTTEITKEGLLARINWNDSDATAYQIELAYQLPLKPSEDVWLLGGVQLTGVRNQKHSFFLGPFDGLRIDPLQGNWSEVTRVPVWVNEVTEGEELHFIETGDDAFVSVKTIQLPRLEAASATILHAEFATELVAQGGVLNHAQLEFEHSGPAVYSFELPRGANLLDCGVGDRQVMPLILSDGSLQLGLPRSNSGKTYIKYTYTTKSPKFDPVEGKSVVELPRTPLFIKRLNWAVKLPAAYEATALEGNVEILGGVESSHTIQLIKRLCHDEVPHAELYYTRRDLQL